MIGLKSVNLVPEQELMQSLAPLWRKRFLQAISLMLESLGQTPAPSLDEIAQQCAISPFHFHRMFRVIFHETPAQYIRRMRLQMAVRLLIDSAETRVTLIAQDCGFSSSQALAKALKRELGKSAKEIRSMMFEGRSQKLELLLLKLGHPESRVDECLETAMARKIPFQVIDYPERFLRWKRFEGRDSLSWLVSGTSFLRKVMVSCLRPCVFQILSRKNSRCWWVTKPDRNRGQT